MIQPKLFIDTGKIDQSTGLTVSNWQSADLSDKVSIVLKDSIKKAKDVAKVFTTYTNPFKLPASKTNNIIFKRFSNNKVFDGYDPRRKYDARIQLNGVDYKKGYIKLNGVDLQDNLPTQYNIQFFGELISLKDTLSESKLRDLTGLDKYSFPFDTETVKIGAEQGFNVVVNDGLGLRQIVLVSVTAASSVTGTINLVLNGVSNEITVSANVSRPEIAGEIVYQVNGINGYSASQNGRIVAIIADTDGLESAPSVSVGTATGFTAITSIFRAGSTTAQDDSTVDIIGSDTGMIKFPLLSHTRGFEYDRVEGQVGNLHQGFHRIYSAEENAANRSLLDHPEDLLSKFDLKPAIRIPYIFQAIEDTFSTIRFNKDWLFGTNGQGASPVEELYLWLHRSKGSIDDGTTSVYRRQIRSNGAGESLNEMTLISIDDNDNRPFIVEQPAIPQELGSQRYLVNIGLFAAAVDGDISVTIDFYKNGVSEKIDTYTEKVQATVGGEFNSNTTFQPISAGYHYFEVTITAESKVLSYAPLITITEQVLTGFPLRWQDSTSGSDYGAAGVGHILRGVLGIPIPCGIVNTLPNLNPSLLMPDYKVIDFLSDLFKMFNLVAYEQVQEDGSYKINIESYDNYINTGIKYDITQYIDIAKSSVERISPFSTVEYKFSDPKTFLAINQKEITGDSFGNASFNVDSFSEGSDSSNSLLFDGGKYSVDLKLEKLMYERIVDSGGVTTDIQWGWMVNGNKTNVPEPVLGDPLYMFTNRRNIGFPNSNATPIAWGGDTSGVDSQYFIMPSNVSSFSNQSLHFNAEYNEYNSQLNDESLFNNFHRNHIKSIYSPFAKKIKVSAFLPPLIFNRLRLNSSIMIDNIVYFIDEMDINVTTSRVKFSLLRTTDITTSYQGKDATGLNWEDEALEWELQSKVWDAYGDAARQVTASIFYTRVTLDGGIVESEESIEIKLNV